VGRRRYNNIFVEAAGWQEFHRKKGAENQRSKENGLRQWVEGVWAKICFKKN